MTLLVVYQVLPVEEDNKATSAVHSISEEWLGSHLGMPEAAREHTRKIIQGMARVFHCA